MKEILLKPASAVMRRTLRFKNNHKCMYCGEPLYRVSTCCEHILPQLLIKYIEYSDEELDYFKSLYEDYRNMYLIHKSCLHTGRPKAVIDEEGIDNLYISKIAKSELKELLKEAEKYINNYNAFCEEQLKLQKGHCYLCGDKIISAGNGTIRRKDDERTRFDRDNVMLVCPICNRSLKRVRSTIRQDEHIAIELNTLEDEELLEDEGEIEKSGVLEENIYMD